MIGKIRVASANCIQFIVISADGISMSDFTKTELESILDAFNYIEDSGSWRHREGWDDPIKKKIIAMLDNKKCDHEWVSLFVIDEKSLVVLGGTGFKCLQCNRIVQHEWGNNDRRD